MPIYEYECGACGHSFEELIRAESDEKSLACPSCGARKNRRRPSVFSPHGASATPLPRGGCGRCGDPNGPCGIG